MAGKSLGHECHLCLLLFRGKLDGAGQAQGFEQRHNLPGHVKLPPIKAMACAELECMMVVVPTFPKGKHSNPPIVPAEISCVVRLHVHTSTSSLAQRQRKNCQVCSADRGIYHHYRSMHGRQIRSNGYAYSSAHVHIRGIHYASQTVQQEALACHIVSILKQEVLHRYIMWMVHSVDISQWSLT